MGAIFLHESYRSADLFLCDCTLGVVVLQPMSGDKIEKKKKKDFFLAHLSNLWLGTLLCKYLGAIAEIIAHKDTWTPAALDASVTVWAG